MSKQNMHRRFIRRLFGSVGLFGASVGTALATGPDFTTLTAGIDFSTLILALFALFGALIPVGIVMKGGNAITRKLGFK